MSENIDRGRRISRRTLLKGAGFLAGGAVAAAAVPKVPEWLQQGGRAIEKLNASATDDQGEAIKTFNDKEKSGEEIISTLVTGDGGANLRSRKKPSGDKETNRTDNNFLADTWKANTRYTLPIGAIKVTGIDPYNPKRKAEWYFIATERDLKTGEVVGGYFSYAGNFTQAIPAAQK